MIYVKLCGRAQCLSFILSGLCQGRLGCHQVGQFDKLLNAELLGAHGHQRPVEEAFRGPLPSEELAQAFCQPSAPYLLQLSLQTGFYICLNNLSTFLKL